MGKEVVVNNKLYSAALFGYELIASDVCADRVQARRHKKKRINKKWRKRYGFKAIPWKKLIITADRQIIGHPTMINALLLQLQMEDKIYDE